MGAKLLMKCLIALTLLLFPISGYSQFWIGQVNTSGFNNPSLPVWSAAVRAMQSGTANARLLVLSDSTGVGFGAPTPSSFTNSSSTSWPAVLQSLLNASPGNFPSLNKYFWNDGNVGVSGYTLPQLDPRVTENSGWTVGGGGAYMGGTGVLNTTTTNALTFTPGVSFDTIEVYYAQGVNGAFTTDIGGASLGTTTTTTGAGASIQKATFTVSLGNNSVNIKWTGAGTGVIIFSVNTYVAANKSVQVFNVSGGGYKIADVLTGAGTGYQAGVNIGVVAPHLTVICLTINDWAAGTNIATFSNNTQSLITSAKSYGDVILMTGVPSATSVASQATQDQYTSVYQTLATSNNLILIDMKAQWTSYVVANAAGLMSDTAHPDQSGYDGGGDGLTGISQVVSNAITIP